MVGALLGWFSANARDLPWRRTRDPYAIWISEVMLQQTQVKTVIPYWERWMRALPDVQSLAKATPEKVLKLWEGLGYYSRAHRLREAAQVIVGEHGGKFPTSFEAVQELPGVGRYTAGAVCSMAFNQPAPVLDGNLIRVLTRAFGIRGNPRRRSVSERLWQIAGQLVQSAHRLETVAETTKQRGGGNDRAAISGSRSGPAPAGWCSALNQSLMELGAVVCTPRHPRCEDCPIRRRCVACREGCQEALPQLPAPPASRKRRFVVFAVERDGRFLIHRRPSGEVNAHLWEFPNLEVSRAIPPEDLARLARQHFGLEVTDVHRLCVLRHSITRSRIMVEVHLGTVPLAKPQAKASTCWLGLSEMNRLPFSAVHRRILGRLAERGPR
ncbi:MAG: A/G-specific adenine glycosylase [Verrucomicrobia bacterium]|nr:A/G-specific adenine glycosylase [Verrucomicrobiota bacterium]